MSPRFASSSTGTPSGTCCRSSIRAFQPSGPYCSQNAAFGLKQQACSAVRSITATQWRSAAPAPPAMRSGSGSRLTQSRERRERAAWRRRSKNEATNSVVPATRRSGLRGDPGRGHRLAAVFRLFEDGLPPAPVRHPAVGTQIPGRWLAAARALAQVTRLVESPALHGLAAMLEKPHEELVFGARLPLLKGVQHVLVGKGLGAPGHRTLLEDVVDALDDRVRRGLTLAESVERLDLAHEPWMRALEHRALAAQVVGVPVHHVAKQSGRLVVQVVPGGHHVVAEVRRHPVEVVPLDRAAGRTGLTAASVEQVRHHKAVVLLEVDLVQGESVPGCERLGLLLGAARVVGNPEPDVHAVRLVAKSYECVPEAQRVLAPGDRDQDPLVAAEHSVMVDARLNLGAEPVRVAAGAVGRPAAPDLDVGRCPAAAAAHLRQAPPEMTGHTSSSSPSVRRTSLVSMSSPRTTIWASRSRPSALSRSATVRASTSLTCRSGSIVTRIRPSLSSRARARIRAMDDRPIRGEPGVRTRGGTSGRSG